MTDTPVTTATASWGLRATIREDLRVMGCGDKGYLYLIAAFFIRMDFPAALLHRLSAWCDNKGILGKLCAVLLWRFNLFYTGCDIRPDARIGPGLNMPHPLGIIIGPSTIGRNAMILKNVTFGMREMGGDLKNRSLFPTVGDDVILGTNVVMTGGVHIGDGARLAPNSVVTRDVPAGCVALGNPARILAPAADTVRNDKESST